MKKYIIIGGLVAIYLGFGYFLFKDLNNPINSYEIEIEQVSKPSPSPTQEKSKIEDSDDEIKMKQIYEYNELMDRQECEQEWFEEYIEFITSTDLILDPPERITDYYSEEEIELMCRVVEIECHGGQFCSKVNVANVMFNRETSEEFPDSMKQIITAPNQFSCWNVNYGDDTRLAVEYAFHFKDTTNGAMFFKRGAGDSWYGRDLKLVDINGHHFY